MSDELKAIARQMVAEAGETPEAQERLEALVDLASDQEAKPADGGLGEPTHPNTQAAAERVKGYLADYIKAKVRR